MAPEDPTGGGKSLNERIATCPIHQWVNVEDYLRRAQVPERLFAVFHELVLARGEAGRNPTDEQAQRFGKAAVEIINRHKVTPLEAQSLRIMLMQLVDQWVAAKPH